MRLLPVQRTTSLLRRLINQPAPAPEPSRLLRVLAWLAVAWGLVGLSWAGNLWLLGIPILAGAGAGHLFSYVQRERPAGPMRTMILAALIAGAFLWMWGDLLTAFAGGVLPQAQFGMMVQAITSFELRARRNLYTTLVHSLLLLYIAGDVSFSPWLLVFLWGFGLTVLAVFVAATIIDGKQGSAEPLPSAATARDVLVDKKAWGLWATQVLFLLIGSSVVFLALPRLGSSQLITSSLTAVSLPKGVRGQTVTPVFPFVSLTSGGTTGSHPQMDLSYRGRPGRETVMYVRSQVQSYWRALTFDRYDGQVWESTAPRSRARRSAQESVQLSLPATTQNGQDYVQTYTIVRDQADALFTGYWPKIVQYPAFTLLLDEEEGTSLQDIAPLRAGTSYAVLSRLPVIDAASIRQDQATQPDKRYLALPPLPTRVTDLAHTVTASASTDYDKALELERYLSSNYAYDLNVPPLPSGRDAVDMFLFEHKKGFCQQFATAMVVLGRAVGLPSRIVTGYLPGQYDPLAGAYEVRASDAHSWVEVYFAQHGWVPFDPTPSLGYDPRIQAGSFWLVANWGGPTLERVGLALQPAVGALAATLGGLTGLFGTFLLLPLLLALGLSALAAGWQRWRARWKTRPWWEMDNGARAQVLAAYKELERALARAGIPFRSQWETPREHLERAARGFPVHAEAITSLGQAVTSAAYSVQEPDAATAVAVRAGVKRIKSARLGLTGRDSR